MGDGATWAAPTFFLLLFLLVTLLSKPCIATASSAQASLIPEATLHAIVERLLIPMVSPMKIIMLSVLREMPEEVSVMEKVLEAYRTAA